MPEKSLCAQRKTKQKDLILGCLEAAGKEHVTADEIADTLKANGTPVAKSTVYRFLASLEESGDVRKYLLAEGSPACYQFIGKDTPCAEHYHLLCKECGGIVHFENQALKNALRELRTESGEALRLDGPRTVFYGTCPKCERGGTAPALASAKILLSFLLFFFVLAFVWRAEAQNAEAEKSGGKLRVVTTIFPQYDFMREITGGATDLTMLLRPGAESHSFDPSPQDIRTIDACDLFIYVGGESDEWARRILGSLPEESRARIKTVALTDLVETVEEELIEGMEEEEEEENDGHAHGGPELDEHVWTSPKNAARIVSELAKILCGLDAANADLYRKNAAAYRSRLDALDKTFESIVNGAKRKTILFGDRFPFRYFADAYGLKYWAAFPGCSTETEASAATIAFLIDKTKAEGIPVVFYREFSNGDIAAAIAESTGAKSLLLHSCHNISRADFERGATYLEIMAQNAENLREALR
ncbi:MAG: zinc ABC transporter substrate-binding protein [Synergistaceae bacterium]|nr:zinc ABC transporter substrate-binding protein [Synergistaceae bacterium]